MTTVGFLSIKLYLGNKWGEGQGNYYGLCESNMIGIGSFVFLQLYFMS